MSEDDNGENGVGDNDADKRPRIYGRSSTQDGEVEFTVEGAEGETTKDLRDTAEETLSNLVDTQEDLAKEGDDQRGFR